MHRLFALMALLAGPAFAATSAAILSNQMIKVAQMQSAQDDERVDIPFVGDSIVHRWRVRAVHPDAVNRGSSGATGYQVCPMVRQVTEFQQRRAAFIHYGTNDATEILGGRQTEQAFRNTVNCVLQYVTIPIVWGAIHYTWNDEKNRIIDRLNPYIRTQCEARQPVPCVFVDSPFPIYDPVFFSDGTHPNNVGYAVIEPGVQTGFVRIGVSP